MSKQLVIKPRLSEKTYAQSEKSVYVFDVPRDANKHDVARAVEAQFDVTVATVNVLNRKGKAKRSLTKGGRRQAFGRDVAIKKAYVTLANNAQLPFFAAIEEAEEQETKAQAQMDKAAEKVAAKEAKKEAKAKKTEEKQ